MSEQQGQQSAHPAAGNEWSVYQCAHGCVHVRIDHVTLTFNEPDFHRFVKMLGEPHARVAECHRHRRRLRPH
jgi:hypothetical protein